MFPFKLAAVQHLPSSSADSCRGASACSGVREGGVLRLLWQAADASEGVQGAGVVAVGGLDREAAALLDNMFGGSDDDDDDDEDEEDGPG